MSRDQRVSLKLAPELFGGNPTGLINFLGFKGQQAGAQWSVETAEAATGTKPDLVSVITLHDQSGRQPRYDKLSAIAAADVERDAALDAQLTRVRAQLGARAQTGNDLAATLHSIQVESLMVPKSLLPQVVKNIDDEIGSVTRAENGEKVFPNHSSHLVTVSETLLHRVKLPSIMFRIDQDPASLQNLEDARRSSESGELFFASSSELFASVVAMSIYLGPLLGCLSPRFWCVHAPRPLSVILFSLGRDINGLRSEPMEPLQLLPNGDRMAGPQELQPPRETCGEAIDWWVMRLNQMFGYLTDPVTFADPNGVYDPHEHQHWMLTFDRVFRLMTSLMGAARDTSNQQHLMNGLLDVFAGRILGTDFPTLCTLRYATKIRDKVRESLPESIRPLLLPAADRAVSALEDVQKGFFIQRQRADDMVKLRLLNDNVKELSPERATALYMHVLRNATHGFGPKKGDREKIETETSLLIHHDGSLPHDIPLLPYLYLLYTLCNPDLVRNNIIRRVSA